MSIFNGVQSSGSASRIRCPLHSTVCFPFMFLMWMPIATCSYILLHLTFLISLIRWRNLANQLEFKIPDVPSSSGCAPNSKKSSRLCYTSVTVFPSGKSSSGRLSSIFCSEPQASGEYCSLKTYDSMILSDIPSSLEPDSDTKGPSPGTTVLALLLKDVTRYEKPTTEMGANRCK